MNLRVGVLIITIVLLICLGKKFIKNEELQMLFSTTIGILIESMAFYFYMIYRSWDSLTYFNLLIYNIYSGETVYSIKTPIFNGLILIGILILISFIVFKVMFKGLKRQVWRNITVYLKL